MPLIVLAMMQVGLPILSGRREKIEQCDMIVAVNFGYCKAKGSPLRRQWIHANDLFRKISLLNSITIDDYDQVVESILLRGQRRFPVGAFLQLAVPGEYKSPPPFAPHPRRKCAADGDWKPVAQRPRVGFYTR